MNNKTLLNITSFAKITIMIFMAFNFIGIASYASIKNDKPLIVLDVNLENNNLIKADKIVISGTVKDEDGKPLEKAVVLFDTTQVAITDKDGKFSFEPGEITPASHNIYFSYDSLSTVVRTYYPVMLSANYDVILHRQINKKKIVVNEPVYITVSELPHLVKTDTVKQVIKESLPTITTAVGSVELDFPSILFKAGAAALSSENKAFLDIVSDKLKANSSVKVNIKAYIQEHNYNPLIAQKRLTNIFKYLVQKGIAPDRLNKVTVKGGGDENTVDLINSAQ